MTLFEIMYAIFEIMQSSYVGRYIIYFFKFIANILMLSFYFVTDDLLKSFRP